MNTQVAKSITLTPLPSPQVSSQLQRSLNDQFAKIPSPVIPEGSYQGKDFVSFSLFSRLQKDR